MRARLVFLTCTALLLAWDFSGADLAVMRLLGDAQGFAWRDSFVAAELLHRGGRIVAWGLFVALFIAAWRAPRQSAATASLPSQGERLFWLAATLVCVLLITGLKTQSSTSCPWDLAEFGGTASYISHWQLNPRLASWWGITPANDGGAGRCFPSGHAVAAVCFFSQYFLWRKHRPARALAWLGAVLLLATLFGAAQAVRGAHYPSHTAWAAWLSWMFYLGADRLGLAIHSSADGARNPAPNSAPNPAPNPAPESAA